MVADTKKVQTLVNKFAEEAVVIQGASARIEALRTLYQAENPSVTGTPLDGNVTAVNTWINDLTILSNEAIVATMIAAVVPSHRGEAL